MKSPMKHRGFNRNLISLATAVFLFLAGCATAPRVQEFPYPTVNLNNASYFVLVKMCDQEGIRWDYDPLSQEVTLKKDKVELKLLIGSKMVLAGSASHELSAPVVIRDSVIYASVDLRGYMEPAVCKVPAKAGLPVGVFLRSVDSIVLDAGHGGKDPGAIGRYGLKEKTVVLDVVMRVKQELENCGLRVSLTRATDTFIPLDERAQTANKKKADLFVSIHANANHSRWIEGFEVYYLTEGVDDDTRALAAAENSSPEIDSRGAFKGPSLSLRAIIWDMIFTENRKESIALAQYISKTVSRRLDLKMLGVKGAPFAVLKGTQMPAVLVEIGYISNKEGENKLRDPDYRRQMAEAIAEGIMSFKNYSEGKI